MNTYTVKVFDTKDAVTWDSVEEAPVNTYKWVKCDTYETYAKLVYIKDYGFMCRMVCHEKCPAVTHRSFSDLVCLDSCLEFFAIFDGESYLNIESNSVGALCVQIGKSREDRKSGLCYLSEEDMFEVNPEVADDFWSVTMDIPLEKLRLFYGDTLTADKFVSGYTFTGNFYKTGSADITGNEHYAMWNEVGTEYPDFHRPEYFGKFIIE